MRSTEIGERSVEYPWRFLSGLNAKRMNASCMLALLVTIVFSLSGFSDGACCLNPELSPSSPPGTCFGIDSRVRCEGRPDGAGIYMGDGTDCSICATLWPQDDDEEAPPQVEVGACCMPDGGCDRLTEDTCLRHNGTFHGAGTYCKDTNCGVVACTECGEVVTCTEGEAYADYVVSYAPAYNQCESCGTAPIPWDQAVQHPGQHVVVEGRVAGVSPGPDGQFYIHLGNVCPAEPSFVVVIEAEVIGDFQDAVGGVDLETYYLGEHILVSGMIQEHSPGVAFIQLEPEPDRIMLGRGGTVPTHPAEDGRRVWNLGVGGSITFAFADNALIDRPGNDLAIEGDPRDGDLVLIEVSADGYRYRSCGLMPVNAEIDLADVGLENALTVRITDDGSPALSTDASVGGDVSSPLALGCIPAFSSAGEPELPDGESDELEYDWVSANWAIISDLMMEYSDADLEAVQMAAAAQRLADYEIARAEIREHGIREIDVQSMLLTHLYGLVDTYPLIATELLGQLPSDVLEYVGEGNMAWQSPVAYDPCAHCSEFDLADAHIEGVSTPLASDLGSNEILPDSDLFIHGDFGCAPGAVKLYFEVHPELAPSQYYSIPLTSSPIDTSVFADVEPLDWCSTHGSSESESALDAAKRTGLSYYRQCGARYGNEDPGEPTGWSSSTIRVYVPELVGTYITEDLRNFVGNARLIVTISGPQETAYGSVYRQVDIEMPVSIMVFWRDHAMHTVVSELGRTVKSPGSLMILGRNFGEYKEDVCDVFLWFDANHGLRYDPGYGETSTKYLPPEDYPSGSLSISLDWGAGGDPAAFWTDTVIQVEVPELIMPAPYFWASAALTVRFADGTEQWLPVNVRNVVLDALISGKEFEEIDTDCELRFGCDARGSEKSPDGTTLTVWHNPGCDPEGGRGRDWFFRERNLPPGCYVEETYFQWIHPDKAAQQLKQWITFMGGLVASGLQGGPKAMAAYIGKKALEIIGCMAFSGSNCGRYYAELDSYNPYFNERAVKWWCTCLSSHPFYDENVRYHISFWVRGPEWAIQNLREVTGD